jgi:hypothetical protein
MRELERDDIIGKRIAEVIISLPDKPITMSTMSYSAGYLRLDSEVVIYLGQPATPPMRACDEIGLRALARDTTYEKEFRPLIRQKIVDVVLTRDDGCLCILTDEYLITEVPAQFWVRPCLYKRDSFTLPTEPFWQA